jgi:hypothetical protein
MAAGESSGYIISEKRRLFRKYSKSIIRRREMIRWTDRRRTQQRRPPPNTSSVDVRERGTVNVVVMGKDVSSDHLGSQAYRKSFHEIFSGLNVKTRFVHPFGLDLDTEGDYNSPLVGADIVFVNAIEREDDEQYAKRVSSIVFRTVVPVYAIVTDSTSIDNTDDRLNMFDNVIVRSSRDLEALTAIVGEDNVTYLPDIVLGWRSTRGSYTTLNGIYSFPFHTRQICVCLPTNEELRRLIRSNRESFELVATFFVRLAQSIERVASEMRCRVSVMSLDYSASDHSTTDALATRMMAGTSITVYRVPQMSQFTSARNVLRKKVAVVAMSYYSLLFAVQDSIPVYVVYPDHDRPTHNLADDLRIPPSNRIEMHTDDLTVNLHLIQNDGKLLTEMVRIALKPNATSQKQRIAYDVSHVRERFEFGAMQMMGSIISKRKAIRIAELSRPAGVVPPFSDPAVSDEDIHTKVVDVVSKMTGASNTTVEGWYARGERSLSELVESLARVNVAVSDVLLGVAYSVTGSFDISSFNTNYIDKNGDPFRVRVQDALRLLRRKDRGHDVNTMTVDSITFPIPSDAFMVDVDALSADIYDSLSCMNRPWRNAMRGLRFFSPEIQRRPSAPCVLVDPYVDRTFGWARSTFIALDVIPSYRRKDGGSDGFLNDIWAGFVHHTFDASFSEYNCAALMEDPVFLESLKNCAALFTLSERTAARLKDEMHRVRKIPEVHRPMVFHLPCPLEDDTSVVPFTMTKFRDNPRKKIVQVGEWLRRTYAIYDLDVYPSAPVTKAVTVTLATLSTEEKEQERRRKDHLRLYRAPPAGDVEEFSQSIGFVAEEFWQRQIRTQEQCDTICRPSEYDDCICRPSEYDDCICRPSENEDCICRPSENEDCICRPSENEDCICRPSENEDCICHPPPPDTDGTSATLKITNKYVRGMVNAVREKHASVEELFIENRHEYDELLSQNAVFLNLVDAGHVDVVHECILRNTPVILNRLPALEDVLGAKFPGFYDHMHQASILVSDPSSYEIIHEYLASMDKSRFSLEGFVMNFHVTLAKAVHAKKI